MHSTRKVVSAIILALSAFSMNANANANANEEQPAADQSDANQIIATALLSGLTLFHFDSAELTEEGLVAVQKLIDDLSGFISIQSIQIVGHTDSRGPDAYNLHLSRRRAAHIRTLLEKPYPEVNLVSIGAGESMPIASNATAAGRRLNRRVEIEIVAKGVRQLAR